MAIRLPRITFGITSLDDALRIWAETIERAVHVRVGGGLSLDTGPTGSVIRLPLTDAVSWQCKTTSLITSRSGATLGTGTAQICSVDSSDNLVADGDTITVKSQFTTNIPSGVYINVNLSSGVKLIDIAPCS